MALSRRKFLKLVGGSGAGAAILAACRPAVKEFLAQSPVRMPEDLVTGVDNWYASVCHECGAGCGVIARVVEGRAKKIEGNPKHPLNAGKLCVRGQGSVQAVYHPDRIRRPLKAVGARGSGEFREISWDEALDTLLGQLRELKGVAAPDGDGNKVVLVTEPISGHLGMVVSRFANAFGAVQASYEPMDVTVLNAAMEKVFGANLVPDFDLTNSRYLLSFSADFLMGWISQVRHSRGYGELRQGEGSARGTFVHVDTRFSATAANADDWIIVKPGMEGKLALSIAYVIIRADLADGQAAEALFGPAPLVSALEGFRPELVAEATGVSPQKIEEIALEFAKQRGIAIGGGTAGAQTNGLFNLTAIFALNQLVGNVGKPGGVILNPASPFASDPTFKDGASFDRYSVTPLEGWRDITQSMQAGEVSVLLVRNANPLHGLPSALGFREGLGLVPFIASFSSFLDDTTAMADLVLPTHLPLEDWGDKSPNPGPGFQAIGFQQPVVRPFHETRGFGDLLLTLSQELEMEQELPWTSFREVLREGAQKLRQLNRGNVSGISFEAYWNNLLQLGGWWDEGARADGDISVQRLDLGDAEPTFLGSEDEFPFHLVPFASVSLTDGRGAHLPWMQATPDPITTAAWETWVELNSMDAKELDLREGDMLRLQSETGWSIEAALYPNPAMPRGVLAIPLGQGHKAYGRYAEGRGANPFNVLGLLSDKETGALAWGATRVKMTKTDRRIRLPKYEGVVIPIDFDNNVKITRG